MTLDGVIFDMKLDLDSNRRLRGIALRRKYMENVMILDAKIEEQEHWLKLLEKIEKEEKI